jgi:hypothetical protein
MEHRPMTRPLPGLPALAALAVLFLSLAALAPPAAAAGCTLDATVQPGRSIDLVGGGFAAGAGVTIGVVRNGTGEPSVSATADAVGGFTASVDAGPGRGGAYSFSATDGSCTATADAVAVETAGGTSARSGATLPPTDASPTRGSPSGLGGSTPAGLALPLVAAGGILLILAGPFRSRRIRLP